MREERPPEVPTVPTDLYIFGSILLIGCIIPLFIWYWWLLQFFLTTTAVFTLSIVSAKGVKSIFTSLTDIAEEVIGAFSKFESLTKARYNNRLLETRVRNLEELVPLIQRGTELGMNIKFEGLEMSDWRSNIHTFAGASPRDLKPDENNLGAIPSKVYLDEIEDQIPEGHTLVGVVAGGEVVTKEDSVACCIWIPGASSSGKTTTTSSRVKDKVRKGNKLLVCDPHFFKPDSLANALEKYSESYLRPVARTPEEILESVNFFLDIFQERKEGNVRPPYDPITIVIDEMNSLNDPINAEEKDLLEKLQRVVRITGTESRNFEMAGIYISQYATGLAWLRKAASMIFVHQLNMMSERMIAVNEDRKVAQSMASWPKGRTFVYGTGFEEGPVLCQQPIERQKLQVPDDKDQVSEEEFASYWNGYVEQNGKVPSIRMIEARFNCTNYRARELRSDMLLEGE